MGFRFRKSFKLFPGVRVNLGKKGASLSVGRRGATVNIGKKGVRTTLGIPGTGLSYSHYQRHGGASAGKAASKREITRDDVKLLQHVQVYLRIADETLGPISMLSVLTMIAEGKLRRDTEYLPVDGEDDWNVFSDWLIDLTKEWIAHKKWQRTWNSIVVVGFVAVGVMVCVSSLEGRVHPAKARTHATPLPLAKPTTPIPQAVAHVPRTPTPQEVAAEIARKYQSK